MGRLTTVHDREFVQGFSRPEGHAEHEDVWFAWLEIGEILSDALDAPKFTDATWREEVSRLLERADLVVIDVSRAGPNLAWALEAARAALPRERVIALRRAGATHPLEAAGSIEYELSRRGRWVLRRALYERLSALVPGLSRTPAARR